MTRTHLGWGLALVLAAAAAFVAHDLLTGPPRPNIILVSIDTLRPDHLGCYGYARDTSPHLDRLARQGVLFETAVSTTSWTLPAHAALLTGLPDSVHGATDIDRWLDGTRTTLAEVLKAAGYTTAGFFSGPFLHPAYGFAQGFDTYTDCSSYAARLKKVKTVGEALFLMHESAHRDVTNDRVRHHVVRWLEANPRRPFFLFVHMWDVHFDWIPPPPFDTKFGAPYDGPLDGRGIGRFTMPAGGITKRDVQHLVDLYDGEIAWTDQTLGKILGAIDRLGLGANTILAVTADHGEEFFEHGGLTHRNTLFEEVVRIPLILRWPGRLGAGTRVRQQASIVDIAPTLLDLAGVPPFPVAFGHSLVPVMGDAFRRSPSAIAVSELRAANSDRYFFSLRTNDWKLIIDWKTRTHRVYDLRRDPHEQDPLAERDYPMPARAFEDLYRKIRKQMDALARRLPRPGKRDTPRISALTRAQLRSLGYLR